MWPFKTKTLSMAMEQKSISLPQAQPRWNLYARAQKGWTVQAAISLGYDESTIAYACIEKRAKLIAGVPFVVSRKVGADYVPQPDSPLQTLINRPNPDQSLYELLYSVSQSLDLSGNSFISEIKAGLGNLPQQLWCLPPQGMKIKAGTEKLIDYFEYTDTYVSNRKIMSDDMIHIKMPNPNDIIFGAPVIKAAARAIDIDRESAIWQNVSLQNRGASDINIKLPAEATQEQVNQAKQSYQAMQAGASNARKALISNADIQMLGQTAVELDFVASRRAIWTEICAAFGMSLANLGMTEAVNLSNARSMDKALWQNTIIPQLELIARALNHQLAIEFGAEWRIDFDLSNVEAMHDEQSAKLASATQLFAMGVPFNEINQRLELGFDDIEGGDVGYLSSSLLPVGYEPDELTSESFDGA